MTYYPVIIPTLNRYQHFKECVKSLAACTHADKTELVIGLDYPPSEKYVEGWKQIKTYIPTITGFAKVTVFEHDHNLGPAGNSNALEQYVTGKYDAWIYTEDDNVFSPCFLDYMDKCLEKYRNDEKVMAICSYINKNEFYKNQNSNTVLRLTGAFNAWGYGIWKHKYEIYKKIIIPDYREKICNNPKGVIKAFNRPELFKNFMEWLESKPELNRPCDVTYEMTNLVLDKYVIYPTEYIGKNMGFDGSGVNCGEDESNIFSNRIITSAKNYELVDNFTRILDKKNQLCFNKTQNRHINVKKRFYYRLLVIFYFCIGYQRTNSIKSYIAKIKNLFS